MLRGLENGCTTFVRAGDTTSVLAERRVLRQTSVVFEVRSQSKMRSWSRKLGRGTHKRQLWLVNEELIVTKEIGTPPVHHELCREFVRQMETKDVSNKGHELMAVTFATGFVFTAHFETRRELEVWLSLLRPDPTAQFPWGLPFEEAGVLENQDRKQNKQALLEPVDADAVNGVMERLAHIEGLMAAQMAALTLDDGVSARATRKRQLRMHRQMFGVLKEMQAISLEGTKRLFGASSTAPPNQLGNGAPAGRRRVRRRRLGQEEEDESWSESDDSSAEGAAGSGSNGTAGEEDVNLAPIDKPQPLVAEALALPPPPDAPRNVVPPMPTVPPAKHWTPGSGELDNDVLYALRRQLASKELELNKVKTQLANLVNESWRKNLQVAHLKKELSEHQQLVRDEIYNSSTSVSTIVVSNSSNNSNNDAAVATVAAPVVAVASPVVTVKLATTPTFSQRSFLGLNLDVLRKILRLVSVADLGSLAQTSRQATELLRKEEQVWKWHLMARIPPRGIVPVAVVAAAPENSREQLRLMHRQYLCHGCGTLLPFGPSDTAWWDRLELPLCRRAECFQAATVTAPEALSTYALSTADLRPLQSAMSGAVQVWRRRDAVRVAYAKYGGGEGLASRLRSLAKQRQLIALSRLGPVTTRPTELLLDL